MKKILLTTFFLTTIFLPVLSRAQINFGDIQYALGNELTIETSPVYPRPNENVSLKISLYTEDLSSSEITWYKDGQKVLSGKGEVRYSFNMPPVGKDVSVEIIVKLLNGTSFSKEITLGGSSVDLVWETDSYVPPFFQGKALYVRQGKFKVVAIPEFTRNGTRVLPQNLIYEWSNGVGAYQSQSGYGKNLIILDGSSIGRSDKVEVLVRDPVSNKSARSSIVLEPTDPEILFYEDNPFYGQIFDTAIKDFDLTQDEVQVLTYPLYFTKEFPNSLKYMWRLNGIAVPSLSESRTAVFRKPEGSGKSLIKLTVENQNRILQQADGGFNIIFEE